ncbi:MAG: hypothetical protein QM820_55595 [Minicystis sp.]
MGSFAAQVEAAQGWTVYTIGTCSGQGARRLDESCLLIAIPGGGESNRDTWVHLSLMKLWLEGTERTLLDLREEHGLSPADLLVIAARLHDSEASGTELPTIPADLLLGDGEITFHDYSPDFSPWPHWFDSFGTPDGSIDGHGGGTGGGTTMKPGTVAGPNQPPVNLPVPPPFHGGPAGPPSNYHPTVKHPKPFGKPRPTDGADKDLLQHGLSPQQIHELRAGRLPVQLYPGTQRRQYEETSVFVCNGKVWWGYPEDCPDIAGRSSLERWKNVLDAEIYVWAKEHLFAGGKNPECAESCTLLAQSSVVGMSALIGAACAYVAPACASAASGLLAGGGLTAWSGLISSLAASECKRDYCD